MGYIFTEYFFDIFKLYININYAITSGTTFCLIFLSDSLPFLAKYLVGYCNLYNQLGYGIICFVYLYRRHKAKKQKNWKAFYGNSATNWALFNLSLFNKFIFNRVFIVYLTTLVKKTYLVVLFLFNNYCTTSIFINKVKQNVNSFFFKKILYSWTPLFKRTSYISFSTMLKRFVKKK